MKNLVIIQSLLHQMKENKKNIETQLKCLDRWIETIEEELEKDMSEKQIKQKNRNEWREKRGNDIVLCAVVGLGIIMPLVICIILDKIYG